MQMIKSETKASLITFLQLLVAHHPSRRSTPYIFYFPIFVYYIIYCTVFTFGNVILDIDAGRVVERFLLTLMIYVHLRHCPRTKMKLLAVPKRVCWDSTRYAGKRFLVEIG